MKNIKKIFLIIIILIFVNMLFMPNIVNAAESLSNVLQEADNSVKKSENTGQRFLANANFTLSQFYSEFSWVYALLWIGYIIAGIWCVVRVGAPAMAAITLLDNDKKTQKLTAFVVFVGLYVFGIIFLWKIFPSIVNLGNF